jgi:hypothetical protein
MTSPTGNKIHDAAVLAAEAVRQGVVNVAGTSQAAMNTATVAYYRSVLASKIANGLDAGNELIALKNLGATI